MPETNASAPLTLEQKIENFANENNPSFTPHGAAPKVETPKEEIKEPEIKVEDPPLPNEVAIPEDSPKETEDLFLDIQPDAVPAEPKEFDWDLVANDLDIPTKGKENIQKYITSLKQENQKAKEAQEKFEALAMVNESVNQFDSLLRREPEDLIRLTLKEIQKWDDADIEEEIAELTENGQINSRYRQIKAEIKSERDRIVNNALAIRKQQQDAQVQNTVAFQKTAQEAIKGITTINGLSFSKENLATVQGRAERIIASKDFQDKLKDPKYVAELAFREATGNSLDKMLARKYENQAKNKIIEEFGNPSERKNGTVEQPANLKPKTRDEKIKEFLASNDEVTISRER